MLPAPQTTHNPFPGLRPFEEDEEHLFFGREKQVDELLHKLAASRFLALVGASGSGKSSLVRSGLIPALYSGYITGAGSLWRVTTFRPGNQPIANLTQALALPGMLYDADSHLEEAPETKIAKTLRRSSLGLIEAYKESDIPKNENLLVVVDQFEELFRYKKYEEKSSEGRSESVSFVNLLLAATAQTTYPIYVIIGMRSDFLGDCTAFRGLPEAINQGQYLIPRMTRDERKQAILGPIAVGGAAISPRLITRLLNDVGDNPDQLPILQHSLMRTWFYWQNKGRSTGDLDLHHYEAIGTMIEALSQHAEEAYGELHDDRQRRICEVMFKTLTDKGSDSRGVRRPTKLKEVAELAEAPAEEVMAVVEVFRQPGRSFLMPPADIPLSPETILDISHESLMRIWNRLIVWVEEEAQSAEIYMRLAEAAALYQEGRSGLWRNPELQLALRWQLENNPTQIWANRYDPSFERAVNFLQYSKEQEEFELAQKERRQKAEIRRIRTFAGVVGTVGVLALLAMIFAFLESGKASENEKKARKNGELAEKKAQEALASKKVSDSLKGVAELTLFELQEKDHELSRQFSLVMHQKTEIEQKGRELGVALKEANTARTLAEEKTSEATQQTNIANRQRSMALKAKSEADEQSLRAQKAKAEAEAQRTLAEKYLRLAECNVLANRVSSLLLEGKQVDGINLAIYAHFMNKVYGGKEQNSDTYYALKYCLDDYYDGTDARNPVRLDIATWHNAPVKQQINNPSKRYIASLDVNGGVYVWLPNQALNRKLQAPRGTTAIGSSLDGKYIYTADISGKILAHPLNIEYKPVGTPTVVTNVGEPIRTLNVVPVGNGWLFFTTDSKLYMCDLFGQKLQSIPIPNIQHVAFGSNGKYMIAATSSKCVLYRLDFSQEDITEIFAANRDIPIRNVKCVALSPNEKWLALGNDKGWLTLLPEDEFTRRFNMTGVSSSISIQSIESFRFVEHTGAINSLTFNSSSTQLATGSNDGTGRIWMLGTAMDPLIGDRIVLRGRAKTGLTATNPITSAAFSRDDKYVLLASENKSIYAFFSTADFIRKELCSIPKFEVLSPDELAQLLRESPDPKVTEIKPCD